MTQQAGDFSHLPVSPINLAGKIAYTTARTCLAGVVGREVLDFPFG